jgi:hypothetical protein
MNERSEFVIYGYYLMTDRGGHVATLCPKCALAEAKTQHSNRKVVVEYARNEYWYSGMTKAESKAYRRQAKINVAYEWLLQLVMWEGKARHDDDTSDGPGTYVPISSYQEETEVQLVCENGHPILLEPYCVKLNPEHHGLDRCECYDCNGELDENWERSGNPNPLIVRKTFAYINYHLSVRILSTAMDHEHIYTRRSTLDMAGDWGQQKPTAEALAFINRLWWHADRNVMGPYWELDWVDGERPYTLRGTHFVDEWKQADDASYEDVVTEFGEVRLVTA